MRAFWGEVCWTTIIRAHALRMLLLGVLCLHPRLPSLCWGLGCSARILSEVCWTTIIRAHALRMLVSEGVCLHHRLPSLFWGLGVCACVLPACFCGSCNLVAERRGHRIELRLCIPAACACAAALRVRSVALGIRRPCRVQPCRGKGWTGGRFATDWLRPEMLPKHARVPEPSSLLIVEAIFAIACVYEKQALHRRLSLQ